MNLINKTVYDTRAIRRMISAAYEHAARAEGRLPHWTRGTKFTIVYSRSTHVTGNASCPGTRCTLRFPKPERGRPKLTLVAWLAYHEIMHMYGYGHRQYKDLPMREQIQVVEYAAIGAPDDPLPLKDGVDTTGP